MAKIIIELGDMSLLVKELKGIKKELKDMVKDSKLSKSLKKGKAETSHAGGG